MPDTYYCQGKQLPVRPSGPLHCSRESADEVLQKMNEYLTSEAAVARYGVIDPKELENNIRTCIFQRGTKAIHNRAPDTRYYHEPPPHE